MVEASLEHGTAENVWRNTNVQQFVSSLFTKGLIVKGRFHIAGAATEQARFQRLDSGFFLQTVVWKRMISIRCKNLSTINYVLTVNVGSTSFLIH